MAVVVLFGLLCEFCWKIVFPECCHVCAKLLYLVRTWCAAVYIHKCGPFHWNTWFGSLVIFFHFVCLKEQQYYKNIFLQILSKSCTVPVNLGEGLCPVYQTWSRTYAIWFGMQTGPCVLDCRVFNTLRQEPDYFCFHYLPNHSQRSTTTTCPHVVNVRKCRPLI